MKLSRKPAPVVLDAAEIRPKDHGYPSASSQEGFIQGSWQQSAEGRRTKSYELTAAGRRQLEAEKRQWARIVGAVGQVLESE